jgi:short-subunit dehydrogenase
MLKTQNRHLPPPAPGSTALITGASSGIGVEIARSLASRGHAVTLVARRKERLEQLADQLRADHGVSVDVIAADVADADARNELLSELERRGLTVEILVNNAGYGTGGRFHTLELEREVGMVRVNSEAIVALCGKFVPEMVKRGRGAVLNTASTIGFQPVVGEATYGATKAFALSFTEALHAELKGTGVTVTALCPGPVKTEFMDDPGVQEGAAALPGPMWVDASVVAERGVKALERGRRTVVPGILNRIGTFAGRHANRRLLLWTARRVQAAAG